MASSSQTPPYRLLGGLRLALASLVMVQHAGVLLPRWLAEWVAPLEVGGIAVFSFFAISGFVIAEAVAAFYAVRPGAFIANRLLRLMPTYAVAVCLSALMLRLAYPTFVPALNETPITPERFAFSTAAVNLLALFPFWRSLQAHWPVPEILEQGWALRVEFLFYLAMATAICVALLARMSLIQVLTAAGTAMLLMLSIVGRHADGTAIENAPYFIGGVAFYYLVCRQREQWLPGAFCLTAAAFVIAHLLGRAPFSVPGDMARDRVGELVLFTVLAGSFAVLAIVPTDLGVTMQRAKRLDQFLGELTYPLYLMHWAVLVAAKTWLPHESWFSVAIAFGTAYAVSALTVLVVEQPVARLRRILRTSTPRRALPGSQRTATSR